jgi:hypothetical protein
VPQIGEPISNAATPNPYRFSSGRWTTKPSSIIARSKWYVDERGRPTADAMRSIGTGPGWVARNVSTRRVRVEAGTLPLTTAG